MEPGGACSPSWHQSQTSISSITAGTWPDLPPALRLQGLSRTLSPQRLLKLWTWKHLPAPIPAPESPLTLRKAVEGKVAKSVGTMAPGRCDTVSLRTSSWGDKGPFGEPTQACLKIYPVLLLSPPAYPAKILCLALTNSDSGPGTS